MNARALDERGRFSVIGSRDCTDEVAAHVACHLGVGA
jgi:hypothetical protein